MEGYTLLPEEVATVNGLNLKRLRKIKADKIVARFQDLEGSTK